MKRRTLSGILSGKTVLITRAKGEGGELRREFRRLGAKVVEHPVIEIVPPGDWGPLDRAIGRLGDFEWVVFTSVHAVRYFFGRLAKKRAVLKGPKVAAIGDKTAGALKAAGVRIHLIPERFTSEGLFSAFRKKTRIRGASFLLPRADIATDYLPVHLKKAGGKVTEVTAYRTVPPAGKAAKEKLSKMLLRGKIDFVTLTSSSTVRNFFSMVPGRCSQDRRIRFLTIGPVTSRTLRRFGRRPYAEAKIHTARGLAEALLT